MIEKLKRLQGLGLPIAFVEPPKGFEHYGYRFSIDGVDENGKHGYSFWAGLDREDSLETLAVIRDFIEREIEKRGLWVPYFFYAYEPYKTDRVRPTLEEVLDAAIAVLEADNE